MMLTSRFDSGRYASGRFDKRDTAAEEASFAVAIVGLTENPTQGTTAQIGDTLVASANGFSAAPPASIDWQWHDSTGPIPGATDRSFVPRATDDLQSLHVIATPSEAYAPMVSTAYRVRHAPPVASGSISDKTLTWQSGDTRINSDVSRKFDGAALVLSAAGYGGVYIDGTALHINPVTLATRRTVTISATNSGGTATVAFDLTVEP